MFNINIPFFSNNRPKAAGILFIIVGLLFTAFGAYAVYDNEQTKNWPVTTGTIQGVNSHVRQDSHGNYSTDYNYSVVYTVNGKQYTTSESSSSYVTNGGQVQVAYSPKNPGDSRDRTGPSWMVWIFVGIGVLLVMVGIMMAVFGSRFSGMSTGLGQVESLINTSPSTVVPAQSPRATPNNTSGPQPPLPPTPLQ